MYPLGRAGASGAGVVALACGSAGGPAGGARTAAGRAARPALCARRGAGHSAVGAHCRSGPSARWWHCGNAGGVVCTRPWPQRTSVPCRGVQRRAGPGGGRHLFCRIGPAVSVLSQRAAVGVFLACAFAYFLSALLRAVTATLAPTLAQEFVLHTADLGLLSGGY